MEPHVETHHQVEEDSNAPPSPSFVKPPKKSCPTRFLFVSKADTLNPNLKTELIELFSSYGILDTVMGPVFINHNRHVCYVCFVEPAACQRALLATQEGQGLVLRGDNEVRLICKYADLERPSLPPPQPECIDSTKDVLVPGLTVIENFVSEDEEQYLLDFCDHRNSETFFSKDGKKERKKKKGSYWETTISRRVQHFGYRFNYETRTLDAPRNICPIPVFITDLMQTRLEQKEKQDNIDDSKVSLGELERSQRSCMTQMTINEYYPGQGISSHIDTAECFGPVIYILSLGCGITMTMTDCGGASTSDFPGGSMKEETKSTITENEELEKKEETYSFNSQGVKKHVWLPARSLLVLQGAARYSWAHGIAPRVMDKVSGELIRRKRRVSFTIREGVYSQTAEDKAFEELQRQVNALGGGALSGPTGSDEDKELTAEEEAALISSLKEDSVGSMAPSRIEEEHVFRVYDEIAQHWHHTRGKRKVYWQVVRSFLDSLSAGSLVADVGCGDGKYFGVGRDIVSIGCDRSPNLLQVSRDCNNATFCCDAVRVPLKSNIFDAAICIAVLHHLASMGRRVAVVDEIVRILRPGGRALIQAWALEQESSSKRQFSSQDVLVPWSLQQKFSQEASGSSKGDKQKAEGKSLIFQRFCHVYKEGELEDLISKVCNCSVLESGYDKSNWFILIEKNII